MEVIPYISTTVPGPLSVITINVLSKHDNREAADHSEHERWRRWRVEETLNIDQQTAEERLTRGNKVLVPQCSRHDMMLLIS